MPECGNCGSRHIELNLQDEVVCVDCFNQYELHEFDGEEQQTLIKRRDDFIMATKKKKYGLTLSGVIRVFRKDKDINGKNGKVFTVTDVWFNTSEQDENGEWFNVSTNLIFPRRGELPENNTVIEIKEAYPMISGSGKYRKMVFYVKEWEYVYGDK